MGLRVTEKEKYEESAKKIGTEGHSEATFLVSH